MNTMGHRPAPWVPIFALALALAWALPGTDACFFDPQKPNSNLAWAEGYLIRITGDVGARGIPSIGLMYASLPNAAAKAAQGWNVTSLKLLTQDGVNKPLNVRTASNLKFTTKYKGKLPYQPPGDTDVAPSFVTTGSGALPGAPTSKTSFKLAFKGDACSLNVTVGGAQLAVRCIGSPRPVGPNMESIEGFVATLPTPLHYFIHSLGTRVEYTFREGGRTLAGRGWMHAEKNWGDTWAKGSVWTQATSPDGKATFVLGGGPVPPGALPIPLFKEVWYLAVQMGKEKLSMRVWDPATFVWKLDACGTPNATLRMTATAAGAERQVEITVKAPQRSFSLTTSPTATGIVPNMDMSFSGEAQVRLYSLKAGARTQVASQTFKNAAFEIGDTFRCKN